MLKLISDIIQLPTEKEVKQDVKSASSDETQLKKTFQWETLTIHVPDYVQVIEIMTNEKKQ